MTALLRLLRDRSARLRAICIRCEQANNGLSRGAHCGRCHCCSRRTP